MTQPPPPDPLTGRCVVVSGAGGAVGRALLDELVRRRAHIAIAAHKTRQIQELRELLGDAPGLVAEVGPGDGEAAAGFVKGAEDALGEIVALISTAGRFAYGHVGDDPAGQLEQLLDANLRSVHTLSRAVVGRMLGRGAGRLVFTGAAAVGTPTAGLALYGASKAALHEYARALATEVAPRGVAVRVLLPGIIDTAANRAAMPDADRAGWLPVDRLVAALLEQVTTATPNPEQVLVPVT